MNSLQSGCNEWYTNIVNRAHSSTAERSAHNRLVPGSNPGGPTIVKRRTGSNDPVLRFYCTLLPTERGIEGTDLGFA